MASPVREESGPTPLAEQTMINANMKDPYLSTQTVTVQSSTKDSVLSSIAAPSAGVSTEEASRMRPKDILAAARAGDLESVKRYCAEGQTEVTDSTGEVTVPVICVNSVDGAAEGL
jgi:hypothetical protein